MRVSEQLHRKMIQGLQVRSITITMSSLRKYYQHCHFRFTVVKKKSNFNATIVISQDRSLEIIPV